MAQREIMAELILAPGTGKALELRRGMILRIEQVEGGQCVDFNVSIRTTTGILPHRADTTLARAASVQGRLPLVGAAARAADDVHRGGYGPDQRCPVSALLRISL
jgi:hypothetical protein